MLNVDAPSWQAGVGLNNLQPQTTKVSPLDQAFARIEQATQTVFIMTDKLRDLSRQVTGISPFDLADYVSPIAPQTPCLLGMIGKLEEALQEASDELNHLTS